MTHEDMVEAPRPGHEITAGWNSSGTPEMSQFVGIIANRTVSMVQSDQVSSRLGPLPGVVNVMEKSQDADPRQAGGPSLGAVVATHGPLPLHSVLALAAALAEVLSTAHADGVIDGDLNPSRVLLAADGPRLTDFGSSRGADLGQGPIGRPDFSAPERAEVLQARPASDIYSLGAVLLYAATGNLMSYYARHLDQVPGELRLVIERCMAADPARRPTADKLLTELTAARPGVASHVAWRPGTVTAGTAPYGGRPAQGWTDASPFPAETVASGARNARKWPSRTVALIKRHAGLIVVAALAFLVAMTGTVYVVHPWSYPVLRPAGLTAGQQGPTSISLGWSNPASGPLPDKYVILRDGAVAATVPGNVNHFKDGGLAPATTYDFRVVAYRGSARSQPSADLRADTRTPRLPQAVFNSFFSVTEKVQTGDSVISGDAVGDTYHDPWTFTSDCAVGPCTTLLEGSIDGEPFSASLKAVGDGSYTGSVAINDYLYCGNDATNYVGSTLVITVEPAAAAVSMGKWAATKLTGSADWFVDYSADGTCGGGQMYMSVAG